MSFSKAHLIALSFLVVGCGDFADDLFPTHTDRRISSEPEQVGPLVGQTAPEYSTVTSLNDSIRLSVQLTEPGTKSIVLYFTMWCPICNSHMDHLLRNIVPLFPDTKFLVIDYVSGSVNDVRSNVIANGYAKSPITALADLDNAIMDAYDATMGTTVVMDSKGIIKMNEDYKDGIKLRQALEQLP